MARRLRRTQASGPPTDRAMRWPDLTPAARSDAQRTVRERGQNLPAAVDDRIHHLDTTPPKNADQAASMEKEKAGLQAVRPRLKSKTITLGGAARVREGLYNDAVQRSDSSGPEGAGWYFKHHADIQAAARKTGFDTDRAINASAMMSPNNGPENEKAAVTALMEAHGGNHTVTISPSAAAAVAKSSKGKVIVPREQIGRVTSVHDLHPDVLAHMSAPKVRDLVDHSGIDFKSISKGGTKTNVARAINVLRGGEEGSIDPVTAPKIHTYRGNIQAAVPGSAQHVEYMSRVLHHADVATGRQHEGQQMLDTHGLRHSEEGLLDPKGPTTEDTWQHAFTSQQQLESVGSSSPAKTVSEYVNPGDAAVTHAYNGEATTRATASLNRKHNLGFALPNVATQEVAWTRGRQRAGKDAEFNNRESRNAPMSSAEEANNAVRTVNKEKAKASGQPAPRLNRRQFKEQTLF